MRLAVLLDLDNIKPRLENLETLLKRHGQTVYRRAFANSPAVMASYGSDFRRFNYRCEIVPGQPALPEEVDQLIFRTAEEIANNPALGVKALAVVSNDNGYASLFERLGRRGIRTIAIGTNIGLRLREAAHVVEELDELMRPLYLGIDLGTTNTVVAIASRTQDTAAWTAAVQELPLPDEQGWLQARALIPSAVRFTPDQTLVGGMVRAQAAAWRDSTILDWKHQIGTAGRGEPFAYELPVPQSPRIPAHPWEERYSKSGRVLPEEAAAGLLQTCRDQLLEQGRQVRGIVLTHPASYEVDAVEATRRAALLSGWKEEEVVLLPEPHAALYDFLQRAQAGDIALDLDLSRPTNLVVYDLGGGTLDVSLHEVCWNPERRRYDIRDLAVGSRTRVGGDLVDDLFAGYLLEYHPEIRRLQEEDRERARVELRLYAEKFKKMWGSQYTASPNRENLKLPFQTQLLEGRLPVRVPMDVETIRRILEPVLCPDLSLEDIQHMDPSTAFDAPPFTDRLNTFVVPVLELLLKAHQNLGHVPHLDGVLLNGGMTLFPLVRERLKALFGSVPLLPHGHPDHAVGRGAALFAAGAQGKRAIRVNPTHISLEVQEEGRPILRRLVAQGQSFPHCTTIQGMRLPAAERGELLFRIWVGMGNRPGHNTSLQRFRRVELAKLQEAGLAPGSEVNLHVDLSFEERLVLTLQDPRSSARFQLEVRECEISPGPEPKCQRSGDMIHREIVRYDPPGQDRAREIVRYDPPPLGWRPGGDP
jgi:molecular chaperone DnaK (HSP70)